jgi:hypothetical protein
MNRQNLINRLVARKLQPTGGPKANGDLCYAAQQRNLCRCYPAKQRNLSCFNNNVKSICYVTGTKN